MKTRIIYTKFWTDDYTSDLNHKEKLVFLYLISNDKIGLCGTYELPDKHIKVDLDLTQIELDEIKKKFTKDNKFIFYKGWIKIINIDKYNQFTGEKNEVAKNRELLLVPEHLSSNQYPIDTVSIKEGYPIDTPIINNHNHNKKLYKRKSIEEPTYMLTEEDFNFIKEEYNRIHKSPPILLKLNKDRKTQLESLCREYGKDKILWGISAIFKTAETIDWMTGREQMKDGGYFNAGFDWIIKHYLGFLEKTYKNNRKGNGTDDTPRPTTNLKELGLTEVLQQWEIDEAESLR